MKLNNFLLVFLFLLVVVAVCAPDVFATTGGLPFESKIENLQKAMTGPVALGISVVGIVASGATLIMGGDIQGFSRTMLLIVLVLSIVIGAVSFVKNFFNYTATLVPTVPAIVQIK